MKLTRKQLLELAYKLDAKRLCNRDIYKYENQLYYITHKETDKINNPDVYNYVEDTTQVIYSDCVAYSVGVYGNIAKIDKIEKDSGEIMFVYYGD